MKCLKRPLAPIEGIPNAKIKSLNKLSAEIDNDITKGCRIHKPLNIHDHIVTTYINNHNINENIDRQQLIEKF